MEFSVRISTRAFNDIRQNIEWWSIMRCLSQLLMALLTILALQTKCRSDEKIDFDAMKSESDVVVIGRFEKMEYLEATPSNLFSDQDPEYGDLRALGYRAISCQVTVDCQLKGDAVGDKLVLQCVFFEVKKKNVIKVRGAFRGPRVILVVHRQMKCAP